MPNGHPGSAKHLVLGVIGHVDHGKTALVRALTGIETDRLPEEKRRGISIALGFAHLDLPCARIHLIDMPGHERFVRTLVSGATGIDAVLLVVAANEGIKPQTVEHLEIAALLGLKHVVIAVSKADIAEPPQRAATADSALVLARGLGMAAATPIAVSTVSGIGLDVLRGAVAALVPQITPRPDLMAPYLPIDRVFSVSGHGTVVTGTLRGGSLTVGQTLAVSPNGDSIRVRGLQVHGEPAATVAPGSRVAVNVRGEGLHGLSPGCAVYEVGQLRAAGWLGIALRAAPSAPELTSGTRLRLLVGTQDVEVRLRLLDRAALLPGDSALGQLHCTERVVVPVREAVILRLFSPPITVAGGRVIETGGRRLRRHDAMALQRLEQLSGLDPESIVQWEVEAAGTTGATLDRLRFVSGLGLPLLEALAGRNPSFLRRGGIVVTQAAMERVTRRIERTLGGTSLPLGRLRAALPDVGAGVLDEAIAQLRTAGRLRQVAGSVELIDPEQDARRTVDAQMIGAALAEAIRRGGLTPPDPASLGTDRATRQALASLIRAGIVIRATDHVHNRDVLFHREAVEAARRTLRPLLPAPGLKVTEVGTRLGISRKYSVPLLEYFASVQFTRRVADRHVLRG